MCLLKLQAYLMFVLRSNCDVKIFERCISMQGGSNDFKIRIGLDVSEDLIELTVVSEGEA